MIHQPQSDQIQVLTQAIFDHLAERGWDHPTPSSISKSIVIEAAELLEHFQWSEPDAQKLQNDATKLTKISEELADVLIYCLQLAHVLELDVATIIQQKLLKAAQKYPANIVKDNTEKYWQLKSQHRRDGTN